MGWFQRMNKEGKELIKNMEEAFEKEKKGEWFSGNISILRKNT